MDSARGRSLFKSCLLGRDKGKDDWSRDLNRSGKRASSDAENLNKQSKKKEEWEKYEAIQTAGAEETD